MLKARRMDMIPNENWESSITQWKEIPTRNITKKNTKMKSLISSRQ